MATLTTHGLDVTSLSGVVPVKAQCLPFSQIPHTARLFTDFLSHDPHIQAFYPRPPRFTEWVRDEAARVRYDETRRARVCDILERQNKSWGASQKTISNLARLRAGAFATVTGQQVGLFGGTVFSIFKALTAARLAEQATSAGIDAVPIFWLATEDHDLAEINHVDFPAAQWALERFTAPTHGAEGTQVGSIRFGEEINSIVNQAAELLGPSDAATFLRESYRPGETFGSSYARLFARLLADYGVILLDPSDPEFHRISEPIFRAAIQKSVELDQALLARGKQLESAGYHQQVKVTASSTLVFMQQNGARTPVHHRPNGYTGEYSVGRERLSKTQLLQSISDAPENFSANVLLRPVMQDYLLPTLTYAGGPAECAYFAQAGVVYEHLLGRVTPVVPRFSATLVEPKIQSLLDRYHLALPDLFHGPAHLRDALAARALSPEIQKAFEDADTELDRSLKSIRDALSRLDPTLADAARHSASKMHYQLNRLHARAGRAELHRSEILNRHADSLSNALFPHNELQEREVGALYFLARYGLGILDTIYANIHSDCVDHQIIPL